MTSFFSFKLLVWKLFWWFTGLQSICWVCVSHYLPTYLLLLMISYWSGSSHHPVMNESDLNKATQFEMFVSFQYVQTRWNWIIMISYHYQTNKGWLKFQFCENHKNCTTMGSKTAKLTRPFPAFAISPILNLVKSNISLTSKKSFLLLQSKRHCSNKNAVLLEDKHKKDQWLIDWCKNNTTHILSNLLCTDIKMSYKYWFHNAFQFCLLHNEKKRFAWTLTWDIYAYDNKIALENYTKKEKVCNGSWDTLFKRKLIKSIKSSLIRTKLIPRSLGVKILKCFLKIPIMVCYYPAQFKSTFPEKKYYK